MAASTSTSRAPTTPTLGFVQFVLSNNESVSAGREPARVVVYGDSTSSNDSSNNSSSDSNNGSNSGSKNAGGAMQCQRFSPPSSNSSSPSSSLVGLHGAAWLTGTWRADMRGCGERADAGTTGGGVAALGLVWY